jgi:hypothetical protein
MYFTASIHPFQDVLPENINVTGSGKQPGHPDHSNWFFLTHHRVTIEYFRLNIEYLRSASLSELWALRVGSRRIDFKKDGAKRHQTLSLTLNVEP